MYIALLCAAAKLSRANDRQIPTVTPSCPEEVQTRFRLHALQGSGYGGSSMNNPRYGTNNDSAWVTETRLPLSRPPLSVVLIVAHPALGMPNNVRKWPNFMLLLSTRPAPGSFNRRKGDEASFAGFSSGLNSAQPRMNDGTGGFNRGKRDQDSFARSSSELNNAQPGHGTGQGGTPTLKDSK